MSKIIRRTGADELAAMVREYRAAKRVIKESTSRSNTVRDRLKDRIANDESATVVDGHRFLKVEGVHGIDSVKLQRSQSVSYDMGALEELLKDKGLWKPVSEGGVLNYKPVVDQDELESLRYRNLLSADDFEKVTVVEEKTPSLILLEE